MSRATLAQIAGGDGIVASAPTLLSWSEEFNRVEALWGAPWQPYPGFGGAGDYGSDAPFIDGSIAHDHVVSPASAPLFGMQIFGSDAALVGEIMATGEWSLQTEYVYTKGNPADHTEVDVFVGGDYEVTVEEGSLGLAVSSPGIDGEGTNVPIDQPLSGHRYRIEMEASRSRNFFRAKWFDTADVDPGWMASVPYGDPSADERELVLDGLTTLQSGSFVDIGWDFVRMSGVVAVSVGDSTDCWVNPPDGILDDWGRMLTLDVGGSGTESDTVPGQASYAPYAWTARSFGVVTPGATATLDGTQLSIQPDNSDPTTGRGVDFRIAMLLPFDCQQVHIEVPVTLVPVPSTTPTDMTLGNVQIRSFTEFVVQLDRTASPPEGTDPFLIGFGALDHFAGVFVENWAARFYFQTVVGGPYTEDNDSYAELNNDEPAGVDYIFPPGGGPLSVHGSGADQSVLAAPLVLDVTDGICTTSFLGQTLSQAVSPADLGPADTIWTILTLMLQSGCSENTTSEGAEFGAELVAIGPLVVTSSMPNCVDAALLSAGDTALLRGRQR